MNDCDQIYLVHGMVKQRRIVVRDKMHRLYSIPESYDRKFLLKNKKRTSIIASFSLLFIINLFATSDWICYFVPGRRAKYCDERICLCVCLSVCMSVCLSTRMHIWKNHIPELHEIFCKCYLWPSPGPPLTTLQYGYVPPVLWMTSLSIMASRAAASTPVLEYYSSSKLLE